MRSGAQLALGDLLQISTQKIHCDPGYRVTAKEIPSRGKKVVNLRFTQLLERNSMPLEPFGEISLKIEL
jgi:hypothetical protein